MGLNIAIPICLCIYRYIRQCIYNSRHATAQRHRSIPCFQSCGPRVSLAAFQGRAPPRCQMHCKSKSVDSSSSVHGSAGDTDCGMLGKHLSECDNKSRKQNTTADKHEHSKAFPARFVNKVFGKNSEMLCSSICFATSTARIRARICSGL